MRDKLHAASGAVVLLCLATFRYGGHCVTVHEAIGGASTSAPSARFVASPHDGTRVVQEVEAGVHVPWSRVLHAVAPDVGLELTVVGLDELTASPATLNFVNFGEIRCPTILDLSHDLDGWAALKQSKGIDCAPIVVLGFVGADGRSMRYAGNDIPLAWFAGECLHLGARCTFVACRDEGCIADTRASAGDIFKAELSPYLGEFFRRVVRQPAPPAVIAQPAAVDGEPVVELASPRPAGPVDHGSSSVRQIRQ